MSCSKSYRLCKSATGYVPTSKKNIVEAQAALCLQRMQSKGYMCIVQHFYRAIPPTTAIGRIWSTAELVFLFRKTSLRMDELRPWWKEAIHPSYCVSQPIKSVQWTTIYKLIDRVLSIRNIDLSKGKISTPTPRIDFQSRQTLSYRTYLSGLSKVYGRTSWYSGSTDGHGRRKERWKSSIDDILYSVGLDVDFPERSQYFAIGHRYF